MIETTEDQVIATLFNNPEEILWVSEILKVEDFRNGFNATVFAEFQTMTTAGLPIDIFTLMNSLQKQGALGAAGGVDRLKDLAEAGLIGTVYLPDHVATVKELATRNKLNFALGAAKEALKDLTVSVGQIGAMAEKAALMAVSGGESMEKLAYEYIPEVFSIIERQAKGEITGLKTGLDKLDQHLSGLQNTDLIVIGGRPRMGKTALATGIAANVAIEQKKSVAFFSMEMAARQIVERNLFSRAGISSQVLRSGCLPRTDYPRLGNTVPIFKGVKWMIDGSTTLTPLGLMSKCRRHKLKHGLDLVVVDNIQKMKSDGNFGANKRLETAEITNALKNMAKELNVPVIAISHLSRGVDQREDKRPQLSDLQESGNIEQDADIVLFVYRKEEYEKVNPDEIGHTELLISKYRNGQPGTVLAYFNKNLTQFENPKKGWN